MASEEEDDYMNFALPDLTPSKKETSLQRTARLKKEGQERGRIPSKAEKAAAAAQAQATALATQLDSTNKGAQMMAKMGFKGGALGRSEDARTTPVELLMKDDRGGIGMDSEKKRKVREAAEEREEEGKRQKVGVEEFRERARVEREERRGEGLVWGAMKVLEGFEEEEVGAEVDDEVEEDEDGSAKGPKGGDETTSKGKGRSGTGTKRLGDVNVLYRPLLKQRLEKDRDRQMRHELNNSLSTRNDDSDDEKETAFDPHVDELDDEDAELADFEALPATEKLTKLVMELREKYRYCFWCKYRYPDAEMDGCPGLTEDEHG